MHPSSTLYYREGSSDKVYQCAIEPSSNNPGYHVMFAYGRRGSTLTYGRKNDEPVTLAEAQKIYAKLVREKKAKGYTEDTSGTPVPSAARTTIPSDAAPSTAPMLLNSIDEAEAQRLLADPAWVLQEKHDGRRLTVRVHASGQCEGFNKLGKPVPVPTVFSEALRPAATHGPMVLDGEAVGDVFHVFDCLEAGGDDMSFTSYRARIYHAHRLCEKAGPAVKMVLTASTMTVPNKCTLYADLQKRSAEGVVFKKINAPWSAGRPNSGGDALKFKFVETASFIVRSVNAKRSVQLALVRDTADVLSNVGNVTIPPNKRVPAPGAIVEVRYLYAYRGGSIYQPVYLGERDDVERSECHTGQLKYKAA